ncbi:MAG: undecaprenyl-diphosphate phosphatase [Candidatus Omnitrophota bacterium]|nr:undecaprenyl-diphosphate phosphatase [Candidatus Omnitrophota bacterium]MDZ4241864.1 undecaprenyl-diphosphate phosphatase [Candidatus Omnitrophota bacterium]
MNLWDAVILGIVEGITEFLPVSSTGHLLLANRLLGHEPTDFLKSFDITIQLGAILAVVVLYGRSLLVDRKVLMRVAAAFIPTAVAGLIFYKLIKNVLMDSAPVVLWSLFLGGIFLIVFEKFHKEPPGAEGDIRKIPYGTAALIGLFQALAMVPGVSRSAATIIGGLLLGVRRKTIVEFSFLLAVPTMLAATALDLLKNASAFSADQAAFLATGFAASFAVAIFSIKFLLYYIQRNNFILFGVYRIFAALVFWWIIRP